MPSVRSRRSLDLLNFFIADVQTGFGPFIAVYLTASKWTQVEIGFALTLGTITAMLSQVPAGAFVDAIRSKRMSAACGILAIMASALLFAMHPAKLSVYVAEILHGFASCIISPAIAAISLRLVGHAALGERLGRNARFASIGNGVAAAVMGAVGSYLSNSAVFWLTAALGVPGLIALYFIEPVAREVRQITTHRFTWASLREVFTGRTLIVFWIAAMLFHLSNAAMLPLAGTEATQSRRQRRQSHHRRLHRRAADSGCADLAVDRTGSGGARATLRPGDRLGGAPGPWRADGPAAQARIC